MTDDDKSTDDMNAQEQQNYFNELAEKMMKGEITREMAVSLYHSKYEADTCDYQYILEENQKLKEELAALRDTEKHIIIPAYWFIDEETGEKVYDTDEMESEFHDAMVDLGAYNDELRCEGCDKRFGKTESSFQNAEGLAVCVDCFTSEESGEE
jgi:hypothetical protein